MNNEAFVLGEGFAECSRHVQVGTVVFVHDTDDVFDGIILSLKTLQTLRDDQLAYAASITGSTWKLTLIQASSSSLYPTTAMKTCRILATCSVISAPGALSALSLSTSATTSEVFEILFTRARLTEATVA